MNPVRILYESYMTEYKGIMGNEKIANALESKAKVPEFAVR